MTLPTLPTLTQTGVEYAWRELARRAGVGHSESDTGFENLNINVHYREPLASELRPGNVFVLPCRPEAWKALVEETANPVRWLRKEQVMPPGEPLPIGQTLPVL